MNKPKFTPGPWHIYSSEDQEAIVAVNSDSCICITADVSQDLDGGLANARLIAAAPEMYEALQYLLRVALRVPDAVWAEAYRSTDPHGIGACDVAREVLNKIDGGSNE